MLKLAHDLDFADLYQRDGLLRLDQAFLRQLAHDASAVHQQLLQARAENPTGSAASTLMLALAPCLEQFLAALFGVEAEVGALAQAHRDLTPLYEVKRQFVQRHAARLITAAEAASLDGNALGARLDAHMDEHRNKHRDASGDFDELAFARQILAWQQDHDGNAEILEVARCYAAWAVHTAAGQARHGQGLLFKLPARLDPEHLLAATQRSDAEGIVSYRIRPEHIRRRKGFALTDPGADLATALDQSHYCVLCHTQNKDSCAHGLRAKTPPTPTHEHTHTAPDAAAAAITYQRNHFGTLLAGCPLEERISEFHTLKNRGLALAALAVIAVDNPLVAATGHRICNDCMQSCIYQKQEPVNIPQVETRTLKDVLELPWGFEIYSLLTRWNPLNFARPLPRPPTGRKVLIVGMGPAGFNLAHHLLNDGHTVVGIDGLKIEPLPEQLAGVRSDGSRQPFRPIAAIRELREELDRRVTGGFGGVAEYGITVRWDKNFLKLIRLLLVRRREFAVFGGMRFGGTLGVDDALARGFDHIALCMGAGRPTMLDIPNALARGVRAASDFLMALQLTGAAKEDSLANMQLRLPVLVIGGGLTAIDTATEALAYYAVQVDKFLRRYEILVAKDGEEALRSRWSTEEQHLGDEYLAHARALRAERQAAQQQQRPARLVELLQQWGGATIAYRRRLIDSPAYTLNHEEVQKALEEGIGFAECLAPLAIEVDAEGAACAVRFARQQRAADGGWQAGDEALTLPARSVFIAAGTQPNTVLAREDPLHFALDGKYFRACDESGEALRPQPSISKPAQPEVLLSRLPDGRFLSFFGDLHPSYFGNVVKAMGSAKQGYPRVSRVLAARPAASAASTESFLAALSGDFVARVHKVERLTPNIVEVVVHAPQAARNFHPGQFYRLQNYESQAVLAEGTRMQMEGVALTGAWVDRDAGLVSTIALEMGGSADLCATLAVDEPVVLMGPTGNATHIAAQETVILCGGGLGNAVLFSIGQACRAQGSRVLYFAGYKRMEDRYKVAEIEAAADVVVWCCDEAPGFLPTRPQDRAIVANIVDAMAAYARGNLGPCAIDPRQAQRLLVIGSDRMMAGVAAARHGQLQRYLDPQHVAIGSINSPMQCMMKEICAQCLQAQHDPQTGKLRLVFSCFNQDQSLDCVDFRVLNDRLKQNSLQEKLTASWIALCSPELQRQRPGV